MCRLQIRKHQSKAAEEPVGYGISESSTKWLADRLRSRRLRGYQPGASNGRFVRQHPLTMEVRFWPVLRHSNSDQATAPVWNIGAIGAGQCCPQTPEIYASEAVCANCFTQIDYRLYISF